jgi:hypothetical protein
VLRMRHVRLVILCGLHSLMIQLTLELHLRMRLVMMVMVVDACWRSRIRRGSHCRRLC